ncbi:MAG: hypothetical protein ACKPKO_05480, partial [Candidatus Fonsibacter sp.]
MIHDELEYIQQDVSGSRQAEAATPAHEGRTSRLSTITEEPSDITAAALFRHDEPNWEQSDSLGVSARLQCALGGQVQTAAMSYDTCE